LQLARSLQIGWIIVASLLPALLHYIFDRLLEEEFYQNIFRLDPSLVTITEVRAKYGKKLEEAFGTAKTKGGERLPQETLWPVVVAQVVITVGWLLALLPSSSSNPVANIDGFFAFFYPEAEAPVYAFLGAYFYSMGVLLRRYSRRDLKPKVYASITVRILTVVILSWVLQTAMGDGTEVLLLSFAAGIFPDTVLGMVLRAVWNGPWASKNLKGGGPPSADERLQLGRLDGIDLYDRSRLHDEGVTNIQGLANHDLIDLLISTRIPAPQLIDWIDQAVLYLHLAELEAPEQTTGQRMPFSEAVSILRRHSIRTATDLEEAAKAAQVRTSAAASGPSGLRAPGGDYDNFLAILPALDKGPPRIQVLLDTLHQDEWLHNIRSWRDSKDLSQQTFIVQRGDDGRVRFDIKERDDPLFRLSP
jgi:hypothetical protein